MTYILLCSGGRDHVLHIVDSPFTPYGVHPPCGLTTPSTPQVDVSPAMLIPFYDPDSSTLFATGKGDSTIYAYEVGADYPHLFPLSNHRCASVHQGEKLLSMAC